MCILSQWDEHTNLDILWVYFNIIVTSPIQPERLASPWTPLLDQLPVGEINNLDDFIEVIRVD